MLFKHTLSIHLLQEGKQILSEKKIKITLFLPACTGKNFSLSQLIRFYPWNTTNQSADTCFLSLHSASPTFQALIIQSKHILSEGD